LKNV